MLDKVRLLISGWKFLFLSVGFCYCTSLLLSKRRPQSVWPSGTMIYFKKQLVLVEYLLMLQISVGFLKIFYWDDRSFPNIKQEL